MDIKFRQVPNARGDSRHYLYCSAKCALKEPREEARRQPAFSSVAAMIGPDHSGQACRICQRKLTGPPPPPATVSRIPIAPAPHRPRTK